MKLALLISLLLTGWPAAHARNLVGADVTDRTYHRLFTIRRSTNENQLVFEARCTPAGLDVRDPLQIYWVMKTKGGKTEPLTAMESKYAYGAALRTVAVNEMTFVLKALPQRVVTAYPTSHHAEATMPINGETSILRDIFIQTKRGGLVPSVLYVEIKGISKATGLEVVERIETKP